LLCKAKGSKTKLGFAFVSEASLKLALLTKA